MSYSDGVSCVIGRFAIDFISVREGDHWRHYAIEINLRKGGTTLPYLMLEFLTDGTYDPEHGVFRTPTGSVRTYFATDNLIGEVYRGLTPEELIDLTVLAASLLGGSGRTKLTASDQAEEESHE